MRIFPSQKKVGPGKRKYITQYFRTANIFNSNFDRQPSYAQLDYNFARF